MRRVIIESPYGSKDNRTVRRNMIYARAACAHALAFGEAPFLSHMIYTQPGVLDDRQEDERSLGIAAGFEWKAAAHATVVYIDLGISPGMAEGIKKSQSMRQTLELRSLASLATLTIDAMQIGEAMAGAVSAFGNGNAAAYYSDQAVIIDALDCAVVRGEEFVTFVRRGLTGSGILERA